MPDNLTKTGKIDDVRIHLDQAPQVRFWNTALDYSEEQLREAVTTVGSLVTDVRERLRSKEK